MEVRFRRNYLRRCANDVAQATRRWGHPAGSRYTDAIGTIRDAFRLEDLFDVRHLGLHPLRGDRRGEYAIRITGRLRLIVEYDTNNRIVFIKELTSHYDD